MKKFLLTLISVFAVATASVAQTSQKYLGQYKGELYINLGAEVDDDTEPIEDQTVDITAAADASKGGVDFAIHNFCFGEIPLGDILLPNISVGTDSLGRIAFGKNEKVDFAFLDGAIEATAYLDEMNSYIDGDSIVAFVNVMWTNTAPQVPIYVVFKGVLPQDNPEVNTAEQIEKASGQYKGDLYINLGAEVDDDTEPIEDQTVDITAAADASKGGVDFAIHNFCFGEIPLGDILLPNISVSTDFLGRIAFGKNEKVDFAFLDGAIEATAYLDETKSYVDGDSIVAFVNVMWTNTDPQVPIYVVFKGKKNTIIDSISNATVSGNKENVIYDLLTGRRVKETEMQSHRIYLVNGKKVMK